MAATTFFEGQFILDVKEALTAYTKMRQEHLSTVSALGSGAGALASVGTAFTAVGVGMGAALLDASLAAGEFERKLDYFVAVAGPGAADQYDVVREKALQLGNDTIYSADQIADSFIELAKSGVGVEDLIAGIGEAVTNLGAAADMPLEDAAKGLTTVLNTFGLAAEDAVGVVDKLAGAANSSSIDVNDLILTLTYAGASAKVAGIDFEDINTAIAVLGERGIKGSKAGTGLRQMFDKLLAPTKKGSSALKELGIVTEDGTNALLDMDGGLKPIPQLLDTLNGSLAGLTTSEKMDVLGNIFPITSLPTILNLLDGGSDAMARLTTEIGKTSAYDVAMARLDNLSGDIEILTGNLETLKINVGSVQQGFMRWITQGLVAVTQALNEMDPSLLGLIVGIVAVAAGILTFIGIAGLLSAALLNIIQLFFVLGPAFQAVSAVIAKISPYFTKLRVAMMAVAGNPLVLILLALGAALVYVFTKTKEGQAAWEDITKTFQEAFTTLQPAINGLLDAFANFANTLIPLLVQVATIIAGTLVQAVTALLPAITILAEVVANVLVVALGLLLPALTWFVDLMSGPVGGVLLGLAAAIGAVATAWKIWNTVVAIGTAIMNANPIMLIITAIVLLVSAIIWVASETTFFQDAWANVSSFFITLWTNVSSFFVTIWTNIVNFVTTVFGNIASFFVTVWTGISDFFIGIWNAIVAFLTPIFTVIGNIIRVAIETYVNIFLIFAAVMVTIWNAIVAAVTWAWNGIVAFLTPIITFIVDMITAAITILVEIWTTIWNTIVTVVTTVWQAIVDFITPIVEFIVGLVVGYITMMAETLTNIWNGIVNVVTTVWNAISGFIGAALSTISGIWNSIWGAISSFFSSIWEGFIGAVQGPVDTIFGIIGDIQGTVMGFFSGVGDWLLSVGEDLIGGMINGITNMVGGVIDAVSDVVNGAIDWAKDVLGIHSPSRVFTDIGENTILGMINGVQAMRKPLNNQMNMVSDSLAAFYDQVYAAREMDSSLNLQSQMSIGASGGLDRQFANLNAQLAEIAEKDTITIERMDVAAAESEDISETLPRGIRKSIALVG